MKIIFTPAGLKAGDRFEPEAGEQRHLMKVLRMREGDRVTGSDGRNKLLCEVARCNSKMEIRVLSCEPLPDRRKISLAIARIETSRFASAISAAAQMAVREVFAFGCERAERSAMAKDRLARVAREAAKQVGCPFLPELVDLPDIGSLVERVRGRSAFLMDPYAPATLLESFPYELDAGGIVLVVGPVGDLTDAEKSTLAAGGVKPVQLCEEVLRSETAAVVALGVAATCIRTSRQV